MRVPLSVFTEFCTSTGRRRVSIVRDCKSGRGYDFYKPFTDQVRALHERAERLTPQLAEHELPDLLAGVTRSDLRKGRIYPRLVSGYAKALTDLGTNTWTPTKMRLLHTGTDVEVTVEPDVGLKIEKDVAGKRVYLFLLYANAEPLAEHTAELTTFLMQMALGGTDDSPEPRPVCGLVDLIRGRTVTPTIRPEVATDFRALVRAEASAFASLWSAV